MSDPSENKIIQQSEEEYVPELDNTNYFKEQDEKFEELHKKLQKLKEENKRQIDAIINSLDDLMASKCVIEQTLEKVTPDDIPIEITNEKLNVVDLLSKVTGIVNDLDVSSCIVNQNKECENKDDKVLKVCKEEVKSETTCKMDCADADAQPKSDNSKSLLLSKSETHDNDNLPKDSESTEKPVDSLPVHSEN